MTGSGAEATGAGRTRWTVVAVVAAAAALVALGPARGSGSAVDAAAASTVRAEAGTVDGADLYGRDCAFCHGVDGEGTRQGTSIVEAGEAGARYVLVTGRMPIPHPGAAVERGPPAYDDEEIDALVAHVAALGDGPALPDLDLEGADVAEGGVLYRLHCAACHGATGRGGSLAFDQLSPPVLDSEPEVVAGAILVGPGAMPAFAPGEMDDDQVAAVAAHVEVLQEGAAPGGFPLAGAGRVDEGLVAWLVGMGALVATAGLIARRHKVRHGEDAPTGDDVRRGEADG